jgi:hypothetical protein
MGPAASRKVSIKKDFEQALRGLPLTALILIGTNHQLVIWSSQQALPLSAT